MPAPAIQMHKPVKAICNLNLIQNIALDAKPQGLQLTDLREQCRFCQIQKFFSSQVFLAGNSDTIDMRGKVDTK